MFVYPYLSWTSLCRPGGLELRDSPTLWISVEIKGICYHACFIAIIYKFIVIESEWTLSFMISELVCDPKAYDKIQNSKGVQAKSLKFIHKCIVIYCWRMLYQSVGPKKLQHLVQVLFDQKSWFLTYCLHRLFGYVIVCMLGEVKSGTQKVNSLILYKPPKNVAWHTTLHF